MREPLKERVIAEAKRLRDAGATWPEVTERVSRTANRPRGKPFDESTVRKMVRDADAAPLAPRFPTPTRQLRAPVGMLAVAFDDAWRQRLDELEAAREDLETAAELRANDLEIYKHEHPEFAAWLAYPSVNGDVVDALVEMGNGAPLWLLHTPEAIASLASLVTDTPYVGDERGLRRAQRRDRARAISLLERAVEVLRARPVDWTPRSEAREGSD